MSSPNSAELMDKMEKLQPSGEAKVYDAIAASVSVVLKTAGILIPHIHPDQRTFHCVVATSGDDQNSKMSLEETKDLVRLLDTQLDGGVKIRLTLLGINVSDSGRQNFRQIENAGNGVIKFVDARNAKQIKEAFEDIGQQLEASRSFSNSKNQSAIATPVSVTPESIPGNFITEWTDGIPKGSHVRCVGNSRGQYAGVSIGDVGVVHYRDQNGDYVIDFPNKDRWIGTESDIVIDSSNNVRPGALVAIRRSVEEPIFGFGPFDFAHGKHGIVRQVTQDGGVRVQIGVEDGKYLWTGLLQEVKVVDSGAFEGTYKGTWPGHLQLGQAVRVPASLAESSTGWGNLKPGEIGYVWAYNKKAKYYTCNFPSVDGWRGRAGDLEVDPVATLIRPGKEVRIRDGLEVPSNGWQSVQRSSVGTVRSISYDGRVIQVNFPESSDWTGKLSDLETVEESPSINNSTGPPEAGPTPVKSSECFDAPMANIEFLSPTSGTASLSVSSTGLDEFAPDTSILLHGFETEEEAPLNRKRAKIVCKVGEDYIVELEHKSELKKVGAKNMILARASSQSQTSSVAKTFNFKDRVQIVGMTNATWLNEEKGTVVGFDCDKGRHIVELGDGKEVFLLPKNLERLPTPDELS